MKPSSAEPAAVPLLGARVHRLTVDGLNAAVEAAVAEGGTTVIAHHNLHSLHLHRRDAALRDFYRAARWIHVDGMPLVWIARWLGHPLGREHRVTYVDWLPPLMALAARRGWRVFYLGSRPGVGARAAELLRRAHPGLRMETAHGYFDADDPARNGDVLERIARFRPDVLMVGMGMPRQERWIARNRDRLNAAVVLPCGACMDYVAGAIPTPPRWLGRLGLEWAYRLAVEPRRLARRYLVEPWTLLPALVRELAAARRRPPAPDLDGGAGG
jgi:N-acetylglucosaminyldiphosphoundecaprenol N-acetyl-beta-D-mannosaminyltransferase